MTLETLKYQDMLRYYQFESGKWQIFKMRGPSVASDALIGVCSMLFLRTFVPSDWVNFSAISAILEEVPPSAVAVAPVNVD